MNHGVTIGIRLAIFALALTAFGYYGCSSLVNLGGDAGSGGGGGGGTGSTDGDFSDAPVNPGGIGGGTVTPGTDDVELPGEGTRSFFTAFQVDPVAEDTAGPKFVVAADINQDGLMDLVSAWNQSQPVQVHLQQRDPEGVISFRTITIAGTSPVGVMAGLEVGQINGDGWLDIVVLVKANGAAGFCPPQNPGDPPSEISRLVGEIIVYFSPGNANQITNGDAWTEMRLVNPFVADDWIHNHFPGNESVGFELLKAKPEHAGFTALKVANIDGVPGDEIIVAHNPAICANLGQDPPTNTVDVWINPGPGAAHIPQAWGVDPPGLVLSGGVPLTIMSDAPLVSDIAVFDVDGDGDLDIVAAYTNSISLNVRWARNPLNAGGVNALTNGTLVCYEFEDDVCQKYSHYVANQWEIRPIGQLDTGADKLAVGDIDGDGFPDVLVRSTAGRIVQWFRRPSPLTIEPEFPPSGPTPNRFNFPWPVFTLTEFSDVEPEAIAIGDITGNGQVEVMVAGGGTVLWYDGTVGASVHDPWSPNTIIQDSPQASPDPNSTPGVGVGVDEVDTSTIINALLVVDLDGDGKNDIIGTLDRQSGSGLSDDRLVWYRNVRTEVDED